MIGEQSPNRRLHAAKDRSARFQVGSHSERIEWFQVDEVDGYIQLGELAVAVCRQS